MKFNRKWAIAGLIVALIAVPVLIKKSRGGGATFSRTAISPMDMRPSLFSRGGGGGVMAASAALSNSSNVRIGGGSI